MEPIIIALFLVLYAVSIYTDLKYHKIKNAVTFPAMLIALILLMVRQGIQTGVLLFLAALILGLLPELFRMWGSGDSKLFIAASLLSVLYIKADFLFVLYFLGINTLIYLLAGHGYTLLKSGFRPLVYISYMKFGGEVGKMPGAVPIFLSNVLAIALYQLL